MQSWLFAIETKFINMNKLNYSFCIILLLICSGVKNHQKSALDGIKVPEGYEVEIAAGAGLVEFPMFATVDEFGRLFLFESIGNVYNKTEDALQNPQFRINLLEDLNEDGIYDKSTIFADKLSFPQGGVFYKGSLYASVSPDYIKFTDTDGDGVADKKEKLLTGFTLNVNANSFVGPFKSPDGWLYATNAIMGFDVMSKEGKHFKGSTARVWRMRPDGSDLQWVSAGGMNNPVEITFTETAEPIGTQTYFSESIAGQRDALMFWTEGGVYPKPNSNITRDNLPLTGDLLPVVSKYSRVAPSGIWRYRHNSLGKEFTDNLFSAQFNTHRVLRHKLFRDGASFRTEDENFFSKESDEDFHPTDVTEDGDGSLLIVETGGWFIQGCPLSQVSKPELKGIIYRVRKKGTPKVQDPFGKKLNWASLDNTQLAKLLMDTRPMVQDKASELLADRGDAAITSIISQSILPKAKVRAVFALSKIGTDLALKKIANYLKDSNLDVQVAAAHCIGLAKSSVANAELLSMLKTTQPAAKRAVATALARIADPKTVPALLAAGINVKDRFVEHAIIYALININDPKQTEKGLLSPHNEVKAIALKAMDQMENKQLTATQLQPFLNSTHQQLQNVALWVAEHHPNWASDLLPYIKNKLSVFPQKEKEVELLQKLMQSYTSQTSMQAFIKDEMQTGTEDKKIFLAKIMGSLNADKLPAIWIDLLHNELQNEGNIALKSELLNIIKSRNIEGFEKEMELLSSNSKMPNNLRVSCIEILKGALNDQQFQFLLSQLDEKADASTKQLSMSVLNAKNLTDSQLEIIARQVLPNANALTLPQILPYFKKSKNAEIGNLIYTKLLNFQGLDNLNESMINPIFDNLGDTFEGKKQEILSKMNALKAERIVYLKELEKIAKTGDIERGRKIFYGKAICSTCHNVGAEGGKFGPDLTSIQRDRSVHDLLEAIAYPSVSFVRLYETYQIETTNGTFTGIIKEQTPNLILLEIGPNSFKRIDMKEVKSTKISDNSMMPQGLERILTKAELADLMTFLLGQDQDPAFDSDLLRLRNKN